MGAAIRRTDCDASIDEFAGPAVTFGAYRQQDGFLAIKRFIGVCGGVYVDEKSDDKQDHPENQVEQNRDLSDLRPARDQIVAPSSCYRSFSSCWLIFTFTSLAA